jgi:hypothetical protein
MGGHGDPAIPGQCRRYAKGSEESPHAVIEKVPHQGTSMSRRKGRFTMWCQRPLDAVEPRIDAPTVLPGGATTAFTSQRIV